MDSNLNIVAHMSYDVVYCKCKVVYLNKTYNIYASSVNLKNREKYQIYIDALLLNKKGYKLPSDIQKQFKNTTRKFIPKDDIQQCDPELKMWLDNIIDSMVKKCVGDYGIFYCDEHLV